MKTRAKTIKMAGFLNVKDGRPKGNCVWSNEISQSKNFESELAVQQGIVMNGKVKAYLKSKKL